MSGKLFRRVGGWWGAWGNRKLSVICTISRLTIRRRHTGRINAKSAVKISQSRHKLTGVCGGALRLYDDHNDNDDDDNLDANRLQRQGGSQVRAAHATSFGGSQAKAGSARPHHQLMSLLLLHDDDVTHPPIGGEGGDRLGKFLEIPTSDAEMQRCRLGSTCEATPRFAAD